MTTKFQPKKITTLKDPNCKTKVLDKT